MRKKNKPNQILVVVFSVVSGLVSLYFMANREDGVTEIGEVRQGLEWTTMFLWIVVCLLMAHLTPTVGSGRVRSGHDFFLRVLCQYIVVGKHNLRT